MTYIEISDILSDETLGYSLAGAANFHDLDLKKQLQIVNKAIEHRFYETVPLHELCEYIASNSGFQVTGVLSDNPNIAEQQRKWIDHINNHEKCQSKISVIEYDKVPSDGLFISSIRSDIIKHAANGGEVIQFSAVTQFPFIMDVLNARR